MASLKYVQDSNIQTVTLGSDYTSGSGSMALTAGHGARLPSTGDFWLSWTNGSGTFRIFKVTARSTDTLTVTAESSEGAGDGNISSGQTLRWDLSLAAINQLRQDIAQTAAYGSATTERAGSLVLPSDGLSLYRSTGSALVPWGPIYPFTAPVDGDFSWINQGSATKTTTYGGVIIQAGADASFNVHARVKAAPSTPYHIEIAFLLIGVGTSNCLAGALFTDGTNPSTSKMQIFGNFQNAVIQWVAFNMTNATTYAGGGGDTIINTNVFIPGPVFWIRIGDSGTVKTFDISSNGKTWLELLSQSRTSHLTPTHVGFFVNGASEEITLLSWKETA